MSNAFGSSLGPLHAGPEIDSPIVVGGAEDIDALLEMSPIAASFFLSGNSVDAPKGSFNQQFDVSESGPTVGLYGGAPSLGDGIDCFGGTVGVLAGNGPFTPTQPWGGDVFLYGGSANTSDPDQSAVGGSIYLFPGSGIGSGGGGAGSVTISNGLDSNGHDVPVEVTLTDGGSGYVDGIYYDRGQWQTFELFASGGVHSYVAIYRLEIVGGKVVSATGLFGNSGPAIPGDVIQLGIFPKGNYQLDAVDGDNGYPIDGSPATFTVASVGQGNPGSISIGSYGTPIRLPGDGSVQLNQDPGVPGAVATSQGTGLPPVWTEPGRAVAQRIDVSDGDTVTQAFWANVVSLRASAPLDAITVDLTTSNEDSATVEIVCNFDVAALTLNAGGPNVIENAPTSLSAGKAVRLLYDADPQTWERLS